MAVISGSRLHMLPFHRLASGLRQTNSLYRPQKYSFIHIDSQVDEEEHLTLRKCPSNLLDGVPLGWDEDDAIRGHLERIVSSYQRIPSGSNGSCESSPKSPIDVLLCRDEAFGQEVAANGFGALFIGSQGHFTGKCKPCGWNRKEGGCYKGATCEYCHLCDDGALKRKKKARITRLKERRRAGNPSVRSMS